MKNRYSLSRLALIAMLAIFPMTFFGQADDGQEKSKSSHMPYWYVFGDIGAAWMHADLSQYLNRPDFEYTKLNGRWVWVINLEVLLEPMQNSSVDSSVAKKIGAMLKLISVIIMEGASTSPST